MATSKSSRAPWRAICTDLSNQFVKGEPIAIKDPGMAEAISMIYAAAAMEGKFDVGDRATTSGGWPVTITQPLRIRSVVEESGPFVDKTGRRISYRPAYIVRSDDDAREYWCLPGQLYAPDGSLRHLQLVVDNAAR